MTLEKLDPETHCHVMKLYREADNGMDGPRGGVPEQPDDVVAFKLLEAAEAAIERKQLQRAVNILKLVVRDYRESQEAALARAALDQLAKQRSRF